MNKKKAGKLIAELQELIEARAKSSFEEAVRDSLDNHENKIYDWREMLELSSKSAKGKKPKSPKSPKMKKLPIDIPKNLPSLKRSVSDAKRDEWTLGRDEKSIMKEYKDAFNSVCLRPMWMAHTKSLSIIESLSVDFADKPHILVALIDHKFFEYTVVALIKKAFRLKDDGKARAKKCLLTNYNIMQMLKNVSTFLKWRKPYFTLALQYWLHLASADAIVAKIMELVDRSSRCESAKRLGFDMAIRYASELVRHSKKCGEQRKDIGRELEGFADEAKEKDSTQLLDAKIRCRAIFEDYVDLHKRLAFRTAFSEPSNGYYKANRNNWGMGGYEVHGLNWWLAGLMSTVGLQLPILPYLSDYAPCGLVNFWHAKGGEAMWKELKKQENFGKSITHIPELKELINDRAKMGKTLENDFQGIPWQKPITFGQKLASTQSTQKQREAWKLYVDRMCYFFSREYFCAKAVAILMQENTDNPTFLGFRDCMTELFIHYKKFKNEGIEDDAKLLVPEESWLDFVYDEDTYKYDIDRVNNLLWFADITKEEVPLKPRKMKQKQPKMQRQPSVSSYNGIKELLDKVIEMMKEGKNQMEIFRTCREEKLGGNKDVFSALKEARRRISEAVVSEKPEWKPSESKSEKKETKKEEEEAAKEQTKDGGEKKSEEVVSSDAKADAGNSKEAKNQSEESGAPKEIPILPPSTEDIPKSPHAKKVGAYQYVKWTVVMGSVVFIVWGTACYLL